MKFKLVTMRARGKGVGTPMLWMKAMIGVFLSIPEEKPLPGLLFVIIGIIGDPSMIHFWRPNQ